MKDTQPGVVGGAQSQAVSHQRDDNHTPCSTNVLLPGSQRPWPHTDFIVGQGRGAWARARWKLQGQKLGAWAQLSLGRAGTLASAGSSRVYMSIPRRNTASCSRSSWSCSSTGVRFMGEKPRAGTPTCRARRSHQGVASTQHHSLPTRLRAAHRAEVAAVGGSGEDLLLQREAPVGQSLVSGGRAGKRARPGLKGTESGRRAGRGGEGGQCAHMSLQTPLNAAHQGSESSVDVTRGSVHFWGEKGGRIRTRPGHLALFS